MATTGATEEREEFGVFWIDDDTDPLVIYPTYEEAADVADFGYGLVLRRVITITSEDGWLPCEPKGSHVGNSNRT